MELVENDRALSAVVRLLVVRAEGPAHRLERGEELLVAPAALVVADEVVGERIHLPGALRELDLRGEDETRDGLHVARKLHAEFGVVLLERVQRGGV